VAKGHRPSLDLPPFPRLTWDGYFWQGAVTLPSWRGFQTRQGSYARVSSSEPSDGTVRLFVVPLGRSEQSPPTPEQAAGYRSLLDHEKAVSDSVLQAIFDAYPQMREDYLDACDDEDDSCCPEIDRPEQLKELIGLSIVHVLTVARDGTAYVGFEFGCTWEREHGLGVMTHRDRVIRVGGADASFLAWIAERDARQGGES
jgi:hypothetical protein